MQLSDYLTVLRRRWWLILAVACIAAASAYVFSKLQEPLFRSEAAYQVVPSRFGSDLLSVVRSTMPTYRDLTLAREQLAKVSNDLQIDRSPDWMLKHVTIQPLPDELKMIVQVDYPEDAGMAQTMANAVGDNMIALVGQQNATIDGTDRINLRPIGRASPPYLWRPQTKINVAAGGLLGLVLGVLLAFVLEALDNTLKTARDVERFAGLTMLGMIPSTDAARTPQNGRNRRMTLPGSQRRRTS